MADPSRSESGRSRIKEVEVEVVVNREIRHHRRSAVLVRYFPCSATSVDKLL